MHDLVAKDQWTTPPLLEALKAKAKAASLNWEVDSVSHTTVSVTPSLEVGKAFSWQNSSAVAFIRAGLEAQLTDPDIELTTRLRGPLSGLGDLNLLVEDDQFEVNLEAGLNAELSDRVTLSVLGQTAISESAYGLGGYARLNVRF